MTEGRSILSNFISVLVAIIMFGMLGYIIFINTDIWNVFAAQTQSDAELRNYSTYAAYDQTNCRGQDIMSLMSKTAGDPFVLICDSTGPIAASCDNYTVDLDFSTVDRTDAVNCDFYGYIQTGSLNSLGLSNVWNYSTGNPTNQELQDFFLNGGGAASIGKYAYFTTYLLYDNKASTEVVGIVAVKGGN